MIQKSHLPKSKNMLPKISSFLLLLISILSFTTLINSQRAPFFKENRSKTNPAHNLTEAIKITDEIIDALKAKYDLPSLVFGISVRNKTIHSRATGLVDVENSIPTKIEAFYRMASVTKTFTSILIGTLVDAGKLKYSDSIYKHLPAGTVPPKTFDGKIVEITVGETLSMMAGFHATNVTDVEKLTYPKNCTESLKVFKNEPLYFKPGTNFTYSNWGFQLIGAIIENITGKTFQNTMDSFIHDTMKISNKSAIIEQSTTIIENHLRAKYYREYNNATVPVGSIDDVFLSTGLWAAGGLISNVNAMLTYGNLLIDAHHKRPNAIISKETLSEIWTPRTLDLPNYPDHPLNEYGYGFVISNITESFDPNIKYRHFNWHNGGLTGASTFFVVYPKEEIVVVAMTNKGSVGGLDLLCVDAAELIYEYVPKV